MDLENRFMMVNSVNQGFDYQILLCCTEKIKDLVKVFFPPVFMDWFMKKEPNMDLRITDGFNK